VWIRGTMRRPCSPQPVGDRNSTADGIDGIGDDQLADWLLGIRREPGPSNREIGAEGLRAASRSRVLSRPRGPELAEVKDLVTDDGLSARLYRPARELRPAVLYLHGGGFVFGDLDSHDAICRRLAQTADMAVLALDYRLAPEHPVSAAVDDAVSTALWWQRNLSQLGGDIRRGVALAGDSAGGTIALLAAVRLTAMNRTPSCLLLAYPNTDLTLSQPSVTDKGTGWGLDVDDMEWFIEQWVPDAEQRADATVSPLYANLSGLPPTVLATAEHDLLRLEGRMLGTRMREYGVNFDHVEYAGLIHGFLGLGHVTPAATEAGQDLFQRLHRLRHNLS
jgi:acetyl esterase